jgi:thiamine-phosphate pyrophosphorylase
MARCYSDAVSKRHPFWSLGLPSIWLISDARNDAVLESTLARLPRGSGLIFRHYHLPLAERRARFEALRRTARRYGHLTFLSSDARTAKAWRADGAYGAQERLASGPALARLTTIHSLHELRKARRSSAVLLSPVFPTRSHPGAHTLGPLRFRLIARLARIPVIALGGMTTKRAASLRPEAWAAIDGLSPAQQS